VAGHNAIVVKVRDGQVANWPFYAALGVTVDGRKEVLGLWAGTSGEGAKLRMSVLVDVKNRELRDVFFLVCDGLKGLPDVVDQDSFRLTSRKHADTLKRDLKAMCEAPNAQAAEAALDELDEKWLRHRDKEDDLLDKRHRIPERALPQVRAHGHSPDRTSGHEMPVSCHPKPRPDRDRGGTMDDALETRDQRIRHHVG